MNDLKERNRLNGIDLDQMRDMSAAVEVDHARGVAAFRVRTDWTGQTRSESVVESYSLGGERIDRRFKIVADEPFELFGSNSGPNPQELLMSAVNACLTVAYVTQAAVRGVALSGCRIEMEGELDLRGFLRLDPEVPSGCRQLDYVVHLQGDGTAEQYAEIHEAVRASAPNVFSMVERIGVRGRLA